VALFAVTRPGTLGSICPGGQATMAQFLQIPAQDNLSRYQDLYRAEVTDLVDE